MDMYSGGWCTGSLRSLASADWTTVAVLSLLLRKYYVSLPYFGYALATCRCDVNKSCGRFRQASVFSPVNET